MTIEVAVSSDTRSTPINEYPASFDIRERLNIIAASAPNPDKMHSASDTVRRILMDADDTL